jgi:hypothetical protein
MKKIIKKCGYEIHKDGGEFPVDFNKNDIEIIESVKPFTLTSIERCHALIQAVNYIIKNKITGDIVECGVWKGGSVMAIAKTLLVLKNYDKELYLFDTFEGMPKPTEFDVSYGDKHTALKEFEDLKIDNNSSDWSRIELDEVKNNVFSTGYNKEKFHFIKGKVEDTIPKFSPETISILRLDTDWYESTRHELIHLFPRLVKGGVIIIDDYGFWEGAKRAVDEYFEENNISILLNRIDTTGRIGIKM